jgi:hypothetical protein
MELLMCMKKIRFRSKKQIPKGDFGTMQNLHFSWKSLKLYIGSSQEGHEEVELGNFCSIFECSFLNWCAMYLRPFFLKNQQNEGEVQC